MSYTVSEIPRDNQNNVTIDDGLSNFVQEMKAEQEKREKLEEEKGGA